MNKCEHTNDAVTIRRMARTELIQIHDDYDGSLIDGEDAIVINVSYEGEDFELDLKPSNVAKFDKEMRNLIGNARKVGGRKKPTRKPAATSKNSKRSSRSEELSRIRTWAVDEGYIVSDKGRIPQEIVEAYEAAH